MSINLPNNPVDGQAVYGNNTSQWKYPANPADGDIVVRGNLLAKYNGATNTWQVSEIPTSPGVPGPPGPPGPIGPPGQGITISGSVATEADLPAPNTTQGEFWIVDDTNTLHYSDGIKWTDFGGPIQGPQGETGEDGQNGTNGQPGRGWYDTEILIQPDGATGDDITDYRVRFLSNDGLTFETDNLKGPQGNKGDDGEDGADGNNPNINPATKNDLGVVQIGQGIDVTSAGLISTNLLDSDLGGDLTLGFAPIYVALSPEKSKDYNQGSSHSFPDTLLEDSKDITLPAGATGANVFWFYTSGVYPRRGYSALFGLGVFRGYMKHELKVENAKFVSNNTDTIINYHTHNMAMPVNDQAYNENRRDIRQQTKVDAITTTNPTSPIKFKIKVTVEKAGWQRLTAFQNKLVIIPYRQAPNTPYINPGFFADEVNVDPVTPEELLNDDAINLKHVIQELIAVCDAESITNKDDAAIVAELADIRSQAVALRNMGGMPEDIHSVLDPLQERANAIAMYSFPFEP